MLLGDQRSKRGHVLRTGPRRTGERKVRFKQCQWCGSLDGIMRADQGPNPCPKCKSEPGPDAYKGD